MSRSWSGPRCADTHRRCCGRAHRSHRRRRSLQRSTASPDDRQPAAMQQRHVPCLGLAGGSTTAWRELRRRVLLANAEANAGRCVLNVGAHCPRHERACPRVCEGRANSVHHERGKRTATTSDTSSPAAAPATSTSEIRVGSTHNPYRGVVGDRTTTVASRDRILPGLPGHGRGCAMGFLPLAAILIRNAGKVHDL